MASLNKVLLIGNLGADPEMRSLPSGDAVTNIRIATSTRYKDKSSGEMKELTGWHRIVFFWPVGRDCRRISEEGFARVRGRSNPDPQMARSEERRVGKECRSRWSPYH